MLVSRPLAGRYAFTKRIRGTQRTIIWLARDQRTHHPVVASVLPGPRAAALEPALDLSHVHAASILRIVDSPERDEIPGDESVEPEEGQRVVVAEHIEGRSLQQRLDAGPVATETAVEWLASVADALALLHARGAVHGAVSPRALIVIRSEPAVVPILTHLIVPPSGAFCSPERVTGGGPSELDDSWALAATLYAALSRRAPFQGASRKELAQAIVAAAPDKLGDLDERLWDVVRRGLLADPKERLSTAAGIRDALRDWMDQTGAMSLGDFAPVAALVGASEPGPNVGDLSLVAALQRPESPEATAPFRIDSAAPEEPSRPADVSVDDLTAEALELAPNASTVAPLGASVPPALPPVSVGRQRTSEGPPSGARRSTFPLPKTGRYSRPPAGKRNVLAVVGLLLLVAITAAGVGLVGGRLRATSRREAAEVRGRTEAAARATTAVPGTASAEPHTVTLPDQTASAALPETMPSGSAGDPLGAPSASSAAEEGTAPAASASAGAEIASAASATSPSPPLSAAPAAVTACARAVLPEGTLGAGADLDVGYLCKQGDLWGIARKLNLTIAKRGQGPGMVLWAHLGRFDLAAIAVLITRCCPAETAFTAANPRGVCASLPSSVADVSHDQSAQNVDRYAESVDCFISRGVRYPAEWWDRVGPKDARGYFEQYLRALRSR